MSLTDELLRHAQAFETGSEAGVTAESTARVLRQVARTIKDQYDQLQELRRLDAEINKKIKELEELRQRSTGVGSFDYSKDRVMSSPSGDAMSDIVGKIITLDEQINDLIDELADKKDEAYRMICRLDSEKEQDVLFWRYIKGKSWRQVAVEMNISHSYMYQLHDSALYHLETIYGTHK